MKKILGLDIGVTSIGWAYITEEGNQNKIIDLGSRIIQLNTDDKEEFTKGNAISKNQKRTQRRTQRKGYDRYQLRRKALSETLKEQMMYPSDALMALRSTELFGLRARAVTEKISLEELGRVLYHMNQKRGYKSSRSDINLNKPETDYVAEVKGRYEGLKREGLTVGQYFSRELSQNRLYRTKQQVFPREAYLAEFDLIMQQQANFHPALSKDFIRKLRDEIIFYQRSLKSQKGLVSICEFEGFYTKDRHDNEVFSGPRVTPRSSPLFQICRIWEQINNLTLKNKRGEVYEIPQDKKAELFNHLDKNERLTYEQLLKILGLEKDMWYGNKQINKGVPGNLTKAALLAHLKQNQDLLRFDVEVSDLAEETHLFDRKTGEIKASTNKKIINSGFENEPLYRLWHIIYSISDKEQCSLALQKNFGLTEDISNKLACIDFTRLGFGNKSAKSIRKILPYLEQGYKFSDAASFAGYNHSLSFTQEENLKRPLLNSLKNLEKNSLRQPVVEKILNQLINLVNSVITVHGKPDEIRIELARELKQSKDERNNTFANLAKRERENRKIVDRIQSEYGGMGVRATRKTILKWRLFHEISDQEGKVNATCIYCGKQFGITDALSGNSVDVEHIIPISRLFDDSQSNKTLSHRNCNETKGNLTAYDYMRSKGEPALQEYIDRVNHLFKNKIIGKGKREKLLMPGDKIPDDFIERQLRETQYIARKAKEILEGICYSVWSTSGSVTGYLRKIWGWDDVLMKLQLPKYRALHITEEIEFRDREGNLKRKESITGWTKRDDHRHHAIDALVIACTKQGFIQRINTLNSSATRDGMRRELQEYKKLYEQKKSLLENYIFSAKPFETTEVESAIARIIISFKSGKKVATPGKRKAKINGKREVVQHGILIPRGPLSEQSVYGRITTIVKNKSTKYLFENPDLIYKQKIKDLVDGRLTEFAGDSKKAVASLKNRPLYLDEANTLLLQHGTCIGQEVVIKYPLASLTLKDTEYIVDEKIKQLVKARLDEFNSKEKEAFKEPLWLNKDAGIAINSVRCFAKLASVEPVKWDIHGREIGFVKPGNNHHLAIYKDKAGNRQIHLCSFWHAVERKRRQLPVIITEPEAAWEFIGLREGYDESFLKKLPEVGWSFVESLQQNEMFLLGLDNDEAITAIKEDNRTFLSNYLYRVQKISVRGNGQMDLWFRHHLETELVDSAEARDAKRFYNVQSTRAFEKLLPIKVRVGILGTVDPK